MAAKLSRNFPESPNHVIVVEPNEVRGNSRSFRDWKVWKTKISGWRNRRDFIFSSQVHYYQPMWTLVGGGLKDFAASMRAMKDVLPKNAQWIKDSVHAFEPDDNKIVTSGGDTVQYQIMIVAMGLQLYWDNVSLLIGLINWSDFIVVLWIYELCRDSKIYRKFSVNNRIEKCRNFNNWQIWQIKKFWKSNNSNFFFFFYWENLTEWRI